MSLILREVSEVAEPDTLQQLASDLERELGPLISQRTPSLPHSKGIGGVDSAFVIAVLSTPAVVTLVQVLKVYLKREPRLKFEIVHGGGKIRIDAANIANLDPTLLLDTALTKTSTQTSR
jgi:hypothetical protein